MKNRNRNKLMNTIIGAFALVFLVGVAFAFGPGILDIAGTVNIAAPDYVVWSNVEAGPNFQLIEPTGFEIGASHSARIVDARGRTSQRIEWNINFSEFPEELDFSFADITATAENQSAMHSAIITSLDYSWYDGRYGRNYSAEDFGLTFIERFPFVGSIIEPGASAMTAIGIRWDGTIPETFQILDTEEYTFAINFIVEFTYELVE